jgi:hypothetical protein
MPQAYPPQRGIGNSSRLSLYLFAYDEFLGSHANIARDLAQ